MYRKVQLVVMCLLVAVSAWAAENDGNVGYANRKLRQIAEALDLRQHPVCDTIMEVPGIIKGKSLVFSFNEKKEVSHIGISLFSDETKQMLDRNICNFLERYLLELLLEKDVTGIRHKLREYHVTLLLDGANYGQGNFLSLANILQVMSMPVNFALRHKDKQAEAVWRFGSHSLNLVFPLYRELIEGMDKKESDNEVYHQLQVAMFASRPAKEDKVDVSGLQHIQGPLYVSRGEKFQINALSADRYYVKEQGRFVPLFRKDYPEYSMNNLFLTHGNAEGKTLQVIHRQYGHFTPEISMPLQNFLSCFDKDFVPLCHTGYNSEGKLETIVVFNHKILNYIHMLRVCIDKDQLFAESPVLKADFYSNIPQHYINSLLK